MDCRVVGVDLNQWPFHQMGCCCWQRLMMLQMMYHCLLFTVDCGMPMTTTTGGMTTTTGGMSTTTGSVTSSEPTEESGATRVETVARYIALLLGMIEQ